MAVSLFKQHDTTIGRSGAWIKGERIPFTVADKAWLSYRCEQRRRFDEQQRILARYAAEAAA